MRLFSRKTFLREHVWCCHLSPCWQDSSGFTSAFWWVWHLFLQKNKNNLRLAHVFQKLLLFLQLHSTAESPKGWAGGCDLYKIERLLTLICAIVNFATLLAVSRCGNEWMLTVGVFLYPAANRRIYTVALCYGIMYVIHIRMRNFIYHSVGFLHCPSQQQGQCEGLRLGMDEAKSSLFSYIVGLA